MAVVKTPTNSTLFGGLPAGPPLARQLDRAVDVSITRIQEWLEGKDKPGVLAVGYGVIAVALFTRLFR